MARHKIDFGIDLGTTNSAIAVMQNGQPNIIKSSHFQKDTTPSYVYFDKRKRIIVGDNAYIRANLEFAKRLLLKKDEPVNVFYEFKRLMGTDRKYKSSNTGRAYTPEELSAEVLKALRGYSQEEVQSVVITTPRGFEGHQTDATQRAAELAGFSQCVLLQEPIAASMAFGINAADMVGYWLVFDLGGGTFDTALMTVKEGLMKVVDTSGDNHLGGKDIDQAIIDHLLIPALKDKDYHLDNLLNSKVQSNYLKGALKKHAEFLKIQLATADEAEVYIESICEDDLGNEIDCLLTISVSDFQKVANKVYDRAISIANKLLIKNKLTGADLQKLLAVGGPTHCQTLRSRLRTEVSPNLDVSVDPMTCVAQGAALYASTQSIAEGLVQMDRSKIQLKLMYPENTVETEEDMGIRVKRNQTKGDIPENLILEVYRGDQAWTSGKVALEGDTEILTLYLEKGPNSFAIRMFDDRGNEYPCEPSEFTIISGIEAAKPTLTHDLCLEIDTDQKKGILKSFPGLGKNQPLPTRGKGVLRLQKQIRPGRNEDSVKIALYNGHSGTKASYNNWAGSFIITGEDITELLRADSELEVRIAVDTSRRISLDIYFPSIDENFEKTIEHYIKPIARADHIETGINKARQSLSMLIKEHDDVIDIEEAVEIDRHLEEMLSELINNSEDEDVRDKVAESLNKNMRRIDTMADGVKWNDVRKELDKNIEAFLQLAGQYPEYDLYAKFDEFKEHADRIKQEQSIPEAEALIKKIQDEGRKIILKKPDFFIGVIKDCSQRFNTYDWKDREAAKRWVDEGMRLIAEGGSDQQIIQASKSIMSLMRIKEPPPDSTLPETTDSPRPKG